MLGWSLRVLPERCYESVTSYSAEVHAASLDELAKVLDRIRKIKGIGTTETSIHLQTFVTAG
jgi:hypothetical protein